MLLEGRRVYCLIVLVARSRTMTNPLPHLRSGRGVVFLALLVAASVFVAAHVAMLRLLDLIAFKGPAGAVWWTPGDLLAVSRVVVETDGNAVLQGWMMGVAAAAGFVALCVGLLGLALRPVPTLDSHGTSRWARREDIAETAGLLDKKTDGRALIVGGWRAPNAPEHVPVEFLTHTGPESLLLFAPSRSAKTVSFVVTNLVSYESSVFALDIKGELWELTAGYRQRVLKQKVMYHDPSREDADGARFNPLEEIDIRRETAVREIQMLMQYLIPSGNKQKDEGSNTQHFQASARSLAVGVFLYEMARAHEAKAGGGTTTIANVLSAITRPDREFAVYLQDLVEFDGVQSDVARVIRETATEMLNKDEKEFSGVLSSLTTPLSIFRDPILARATSCSDFRIEDLVAMKDPISLYLIIRPSDRDRLNNYFGLLVNLVCRKLTDRLPARGEKRHELLLMFDEFSSLPSLPVVQQSMDQMPGYGIKACIVLQDLETLQALYGEHETLSSNCRIQIAYTPSKPKTAKHLSDATGATTVVQETTSESRKPAGIVPSSISENEGYHQRPLMTPDEVMRLGTVQVDEAYRMIKPGEALIFARGCYPIRGVQTPYFMDPELAKRASYEPPAMSDRVRGPVLSKPPSVAAGSVKPTEPAGAV